LCERNVLHSAKSVVAKANNGHIARGPKTGHIVVLPVMPHLFMMSWSVATWR